MKFSIAEIGKNRLQRVLIGGKQEDPKRVVEALKSDLRFVLDSYVEDYDINVVACQNEGSVMFKIEVEAKILKTFGTLPY